MPLESLDPVSSARIPENGRSIWRSRENAHAVCAESNRSNAFGVRTENADLSSGKSIPEERGAVACTGQNLSALGTKGNAVDV
jgi:hypothetical protein